MTYAKKQKTIGGFYNIFEITVLNEGIHQERICSFYKWEDVEDFFKGKAIIEHKKIKRQEFISGKVILSL